MDIANSIMMEQEAEMSKIEKEDEIDTTSENTKNKKNIIPLPGKTKIQSDFVLSKEYIKANLHDSSLFVIYPKFTNFIVPSNSISSISKNTKVSSTTIDLEPKNQNNIFYNSSNTIYVSNSLRNNNTLSKNNNNISNNNQGIKKQNLINNLLANKNKEVIIKIT